MPRLAGRTGLLFILLALGAAVPAVAMAADPIANQDFAPVTAARPTVIDVLANDNPGDAEPSNPLRITAVTQPAHGTARTDGRSVIYDPAGCYTGSDQFTYTVSDGSGATDPAKVYLTVARPAAVPVTDVPTAGFVTGSTMGSTVPVRVSWCGAIASGASLQAYRLTQSTDGGATFGSTIVNGTGTSSTRNASVDTPYAWRVRTTDTKGQSTATSLTTRVGRAQENSGAIAYSAGWKFTSSSRYSGGRERYATRKGATATFTTGNVRQFAIVASKGPGRGSFHVYVDGVRVTGSAISQRASSASWRRVLYVGSIPGNSAATHTIQLRTTSTARVDLDAIVTLSGRAGQAVAFATDPGTRTYRDDPWTATASADSGLPVLVTLSQASWAVCALDAGQVTFHGVGPCSVVATQFGDVHRNAATTTRVITVAPAPLSVTGITAQDRTYAPGVTSATIDTTFAVLSDPLPGDEGHVTLGTTVGATGSFASDAAGADRTVTISGLTLEGEKNAVYAITPPTTTATITKASQTISFTTTAPDDAVEGGPAYAVAATATSGLEVTLAVDAGSSAVCTLANGVVSFPGDGTCLLVASQAGDANWLSATDAAQSFAVAAGGLPSQTITFAALDDAIYGAGPVALSATASSGLTVAFASQTTGVCTVSGSMLTLVAAGACSVEATQGGNAEHAAAAPVIRSLTVDPKPLTVTGVTADDRDYDGTDDATLGVAGASLDGVVGSDDVTLDTSGATGSFPGIEPGSPLTVTVSGLTLDGEDAPNYTLIQPTTTAAISKAGLVVTADDQSIAYGDPDPAFTFTFGAFVNGEGAGVIDTQPTCGAAAGTRDVVESPYAITCDGGADDHYELVYVAGSLVVSRAAQAISFTTTPPSPAQVGGSYVPAAIATSELGVIITVDAGSAGVCAIDAGEVTLVGAGTCSLDADQAGDANWLPATVAQAFEVVDGPAPQTITFGTLLDATYGDGPVTLTATATSGLTVAYASQTTGVCTVSGSTLTLVAAGTCTVVASQPGDATWAPATPVERGFEVVPLTLTVTGVTADDRPYDGTTVATLGFGAANLAGTVGGDDVTLDSSGAIGTFPSADPGLDYLVTVSGLALAGSDAASYVLTQPTATGTITKRGLIVTADGQEIEYGEPDPPFSFTYDAFVDGEGPADIDTPPTCGIAELTRDVSGSPYPITCSGGSDSNYELSYVAGELVVLQAAQTVTFTTTPPPTRTIGGTYVPAATATSGLAVTFSLTPASSGCSLDGSTVTFTGSGTCRIRATQAGDSNYLAAQAMQMFPIPAP